MCHTRLLDCACWARRRWVRMVMQYTTAANLEQESRNSPSNMPTEPETDRQKRGFSGCIQATRPDLSRAIETLQTVSRYTDGRIQRPTYLSSCMTAYAATKDNGYSFSTMLTTLISFWMPRLMRQVGFQSHYENIYRKARTDQSLSQRGTE